MEISGSAFKLQWPELALCGLVVFACLTVAFVHGHASGDGKQLAPENVQRSERHAATTADQQKMIPSDRELTQKIRKAIHRDKSLTHNGRNIKIFTQDGKVILRGAVGSDAEKGNLQALAAEAGGEENVNNQLEVKAAK
jgi:hyperosmotically inducible protein